VAGLTKKLMEFEAAREKLVEEGTALITVPLQFIEDRLEQKYQREGLQVVIIGELCSICTFQRADSVNTTCGHVVSPF
jgi:hypothetical protein